MSELPSYPIPAYKLVLIVLVTAAVLNWPALLLNHAPLIFSDTTDYLKIGIGPERPIRPRGYGWFAATPAWIVGSLWPVVILQSLITAALIHATLRITLPGLGVRLHLCAGLGLATLTTAPWATCYVMPDALTAPALLGLFLVLALPDRLRLGSLTAASVVFLATASHITHLLTALAVVAVLGLLRFAASMKAAVRPGRLTLAAAAALSGFVAALGVNTAVTGYAEYARGGGVFFAARLAGDGALQQYLADACPHPRLPLLCAKRDRLPYDADDFLWSATSPLREGGEVFNWNWEWEAELAIANPATLRMHWLIWISASLGRTVRQFTTLHPGDGLDRELALAEVERLASLVSPAAAAAMLTSRQTREGHCHVVRSGRDEIVGPNWRDAVRAHHLPRLPLPSRGNPACCLALPPV